MSKAEERANEKYPVLSTQLGDINALPRICYTEGYHQAEKDLKLGWKDMRELHVVFTEVDVEIELGKIDIKTETLGYYQEVLKRFKNLKK